MTTDESRRMMCKIKSQWRNSIRRDDVVGVASREDHFSCKGDQFCHRGPNVQLCNLNMEMKVPAIKYCISTANALDSTPKSDLRQ